MTRGTATDDATTASATPSSLVSFDNIDQLPFELGNYLVFLTVGVLFYTGMMIAGFVDVFHDSAQQDISHAVWLVLAAVNAALSVVPSFLWHFVVRNYKARAGASGVGARYLEEVRFPRIGRRFAFTDHANLCFYYMCAAITTLAVTIAVFASDSKIDYILVNTSGIFPLLILVMYACAMYEIFE